jgi:1-acyl-sn-glycerol-3-phosphate acyltransferase
MSGCAGAPLGATQSAIALSGVQVRVEGMGGCRRRSAVVMVANHASYADSAPCWLSGVAAALYAAKRGLAETALLGSLLRRLGAVFVERTDVTGI